MLKKIWIILFAFILSANMAFAAVEVNQASAAELDSIKGIGPAMSERILVERKKAPFKDWADLISRVRGIGEKTAVKYAADGLTVNGSSYKNDTVSSDKMATKSNKPAKSNQATLEKSPSDEKMDAKMDNKMDTKHDMKMSSDKSMDNKMDTKHDMKMSSDKSMDSKMDTKHDMKMSSDKSTEHASEKTSHATHKAEKVEKIEKTSSAK